MSAQDAKDFLQPGPGEGPEGFITVPDLEQMVDQVYRDFPDTASLMATVNQALDTKQDALAPGTRPGDVFTWDGNAWEAAAVPSQVQQGLAASADFAPSVDTVNLALDTKQDLLAAGSADQFIGWNGTRWAPAALPDLIQNDLTQASATKAPSVDAVRAALSLKEDKLPGGVVDRYLTYDGSQWVQGTPVQNTMTATQEKAPSVNAVISHLTTFVSLAVLQAEVAAAADFADFQARIAAL